MKRRYIIIVIIVILLGGLGFWAKADTASENLYQLLNTFGQVLKLVKQGYVQEVSSSELVRAAIRGMLSKLDHHSTYLTSKDYKELKIKTSGKYGGLGFVVSKIAGIITVISPFEGTPAYRAGLQPGDRIIKIDGISTKGIELDEAVGKMRGTPGTKVILTIAREGIDEPIDFNLTRAIIDLKNVMYFGLIDSNIGYIRLSGFSKGTGEEVSKALNKLQSQGARKFILDLRSNPGGLLDEAVKVSDNFLPPGRLIVLTKGRVRRANRDFYSKSESKTIGLPIIVLANRGSASASEIVAGAIQDWDLGLIVGDTTFGKGSVQTLMPLGDGEAIKLTTARYYTPSGRCINKSDTLRFLLKNPTLGKKFVSLGPLKREFISNGAIIPDIILEYEKYPPSLITHIRRKGLFMQYTSKYVREHPEIKKDFVVGASILKEFKSFLKTKELKFIDSEYDTAGVFIKRLLKQHIAEDKWGTKGKYEVILEYDSWIKTATELLSKAQSKEELFNSAGVK
ncbi:S41 family peptidase [candidate division WOR-3 bacterium]|nr:S41 family peptidase [candidate division WOR-3 bacterium]